MEVLLYLNRNYKEDNKKSINSILNISMFDVQIEIVVIENSDYLLESGRYKLRWEYSPKFNKYLWEFYGTEGRTEIKFHNGRTKKHSKGCPLVSDNGLHVLNNVLDSNTTYEISVR